MSDIDIKQILASVKPKTKAARLRELMPIIEQKISAGVRIADILDALIKGGLDITSSTLKSYLYRHRKKLTATSPKSELVTESFSNSNKALINTKIVSMQELDQVLKPNPTENAADVALYERIAKQQRRQKS